MKACHDFNNGFTLFTAVPVLFIMYTNKDSNLISEGTAGIRCKKLQPVDGITASASKSCIIPKILMVQNVTKHSMDFPVQGQLITKKTKASTRGMIQDKNSKLPFYPDLICRPPPRPPENL